MPRSLNLAQADLARSIRTIYPNFRATRALYIDLEGSGDENQAISMYWPMNAGPKRFSFAIAPGKNQMLQAHHMETCLRDLGNGAGNPEHIVVFSQGLLVPGERHRLLASTQYDPWPHTEWVNLHYAVRRATKLKKSIRIHRYAIHKNEKRVRYSLENLEREFGIKRHPEHRAHNNTYKDGLKGTMQVLRLIRKFQNQQISNDEHKALIGYCRLDVKSMFDIARTCEKYEN